jgi:hypothetical protein
VKAEIDAVLWWSLILFCVALPLAWELGRDVTRR